MSSGIFERQQSDILLDYLRRARRALSATPPSTRTAVARTAQDIAEALSSQHRPCSPSAPSPSVDDNYLNLDPARTAKGWDLGLLL